jgi:hypothetical protein
MGSKDDCNPPFPPNAFVPSFLRRLGERDEPLTAVEADVAGPWHVEEIPGRRFGLFRAGESWARRFRPAAVFSDRSLALLTAAVLPGTGRDALLHLEKESDPYGYGVALDDGAVVGYLELFDEKLVDAIDVAVSLARSPESLAYLLEAAGAMALERCGAILDRRIVEDGSAVEE